MMLHFLQKSRLGAIIEISKKALGEYKKQVIILMILGFIGTLFEGIGINALVPLLSFVTGDGQANDVISQTIQKFFEFINISFSLKYLLIFISILFVLKALILILSSFIQVKIMANYEEKLRNRLFSRTVEATWPYLLKQKLGHLETMLKIHTGRSASLIRRASSTLTIIISLIIYIVVAINISVYITLVTLILGAILFLIFKPLIYRSRQLSHVEEKINKEAAHHINENIMGVKTIKTMGANQKIINIANDLFYQLKKIKIKVFLLKNITGSLLQPISIIFIVTIFAISYKSSDFNLAALAAVIYLIQRIFQYFQQLQANLHDINELAPYVKNILYYNDEIMANKELDKGKFNFTLNDCLEFKNVTFSYSESNKILSNLNFKIEKGKMVGLIGASGAGKTTIVDSILRLLKPQQGQILLDGKNISEIKMREWRGNIGYISQDIFLKNDTVANNIKFYNDHITQKEIIEAAKKANIYGTIIKLKDGFNTIVGERGVMLSAGQRQRIVIARVLARNPQLLILDEATSALDNESEIKIQKVIESLKGKVTVFVIAHRLTTIINSDELLVLNNGKIVEQGQPSELLKQENSYFHKMYNIRQS